MAVDDIKDWIDQHCIDYPPLIEEDANVRTALRTAVEALDDVKTLSKCNTSRIRAIAALATIREYLGITKEASDGS